MILIGDARTATGFRTNNEYATWDHSSLNMNPLVTQRTVSIVALLASTLITACGQRSTNPPTGALTVYEDAPKMILLDLGPPGNSLGDVYHFSAPLHSERGGPVIGELVGSKTLVKMATDANPNLERRA